MALQRNLNPAWIAGLAGGMTGGAVIALVAIAILRPLWSPEAAGWAQAIGTVGAIIGTWLSTRRSERRAAALARAAEISFVDDVTKTANLALEALKALEESAKVNDAIGLASATEDFKWLRRQAERFGRLTIRDWPNPYLHGSFEEFLSALIRVEAEVDRIGGPLPSSARPAAVRALSRAAFECNHQIVDFTSTVEKWKRTFGLKQD